MESKPYEYDDALQCSTEVALPMLEFFKIMVLRDLDEACGVIKFPRSVCQ